MTSENRIKDRLANAEVFDDWPDPIALRDELPPVLPFNSNLMPSQLRPWVQDIAERMNVPVDLVAIPAVIAIGSLIGRNIGIRPQRRTTWVEVGNLWGCAVSPPGSLKSPSAAEALGPLRRLEAEAAEEHRAAMTKFEAAETLFNLEKEEAGKGARAALRDKDRQDGRGDAIATLEALSEPQPPLERRHLTSDVTAEKLGEICAANPQGVMVHRDELISMLADLDQPDKATARGFYLTGWSGLEGYTFDRIMRGTVRIPAVNISIYGTTQPSRISRYIRESFKRFDDGMVQRFQLLVWPDSEGEFREADRFPDSDARRAAFECFSRLAKLDALALGAQRDEFDGPHGVPFLRFCDAAQEDFSCWRAALEGRVRSDDLTPFMVAHLSKFRGLIPRLAMLCHIAGGGVGPVSSEAFQMAKKWGEYLETHALRAYASMGVDDAEAARAIWRRIKKGDLPPIFKSRDIERKSWSGLTNKDRVGGGLAALVDADWLAKERIDTGGRPTFIYSLNPKAMAM